MSTRLADLHPELRPRVFELLARCIERHIQIEIVDTLRTEEEHAANLLAGTSWIKRSKHLPDAKGYARAIDIAPVVCMALKNWAPNHPHWQTLGAIGEEAGLGWGGRWKVRDLGHFELKG